MTTDKDRIDWIEKFVETGILESAFEVDGGVHVTLTTIGGVELAIRERNSFRDGIDQAMIELPL